MDVLNRATQLKDMNSIGIPVREVVVVGAGVVGLWQALVCARLGFSVRLIERGDTILADSASAVSAGMLAPDVEAETAPQVVRMFGHEGVSAWRDLGPGVVGHGSLVVAGVRDQTELARIEKSTRGFERVGADRLGELEPDLAGRFAGGLYFAEEAHVEVAPALAALLRSAEDAGCEVRYREVFGESDIAKLPDSAVVLDCRGIGAAHSPFCGTEDVLSRLRGVRGERIVIRSHDIRLTRTVHLLHPRHTIYVVPWGKSEFVVGASEIESWDGGPATVRSVLELLGGAFAVHPAFGEAQVMDIGVGVRPAFPDNLPRAVVANSGRLICVNGAYRYGYLLAPVLAKAVGAYLSGGAVDHPLVQGTAAFERGLEVL